MTRYEQEFYQDVKRIAIALEKANQIKVLELSGENTGILTVKGVKDKVSGK